MQRLLIISHTPHYWRQGQIVGWGPTVREIDYLATLFDEVVHLAPLYATKPPASTRPYGSPRAKLQPVPPAGGPAWRDKLQILRCWPRYVQTIHKELARADAVQVRCPANISLLAILLLALRRAPRVRWVKYAGNWQPEGHDHVSYAFQRWWLRKNRHNGSVTINGVWPDQEKHIYTFHNPSLTKDELEQAAGRSTEKTLQEPLSILFVGALNHSKGVGRVLQIARHLHESGLFFYLHLLGDGPQRATFMKTANAYQLDGRVCFHGWLPKEELASFYAGAHFLLLPSITEGWPKVISEAMAFGVVPLASQVGSIPQILSATGAGQSFPVMDVMAYAEAIIAYTAQPALWQKASRAGLEAAHRFTYESYLQAVCDMFEQSWDVRLDKQVATAKVHD